MDVKIAITFDYKVMPGAYCPFLNILLTSFGLASLYNNKSIFKEYIASVKH